MIATGSGGQWAGLDPSRWAGETQAIDLESELPPPRKLSHESVTEAAGTRPGWRAAGGWGWGGGRSPPLLVRSESGGDEVRVWRRGY